MNIEAALAIIALIFTVVATFVAIWQCCSTHQGNMSHHQPLYSSPYHLSLVRRQHSLQYFLIETTYGYDDPSASVSAPFGRRPGLIPVPPHKHFNIV